METTFPFAPLHVLLRELPPKTTASVVHTLPHNLPTVDRSRVPNVLRKRDSVRSGYTLIGDVFVYGAVDGELMNSDMKQVDVDLL